MTQLQQAYVVDGKIFATKAEAQDYLRKPKVMEALNKLVEADLAEWLYANQEGVESAFETGTIRRVTKADYKKLDKALEVLASTEDTGLAFLRDNAENIRSSFRYPAVKRMSEEEKTFAAKNTLKVLTEDNDELVDWLLENREEVLSAYEAGVEKRAVSSAAAEGLAAYRAKKAAEKAAAEAAANAAGE